MPQEFHVVQCYKCQTFQVHQVKKATKWVCKMCGEKQSLKKVYGRGSGVDCRQHVQRLNTLRGSLEQTPSNGTPLYERLDSQYAEDESQYTGSQIIHASDPAYESSLQNKETKWTMFVEEHHSDNVDDVDDDDDHNNRFTTDARTFKKAGKRKRENKSDIGPKQKTKWGKYTTYSDEDHPYDNNNLNVTRPIDIKDTLPEIFENKSILKDSEAGFKRNSQKPFHRNQDEYSDYFSYGKKQGSRTFNRKLSEYSFKERKTTGRVYANFDQRTETTSYVNESSLQQRERTNGIPAETFTEDDYIHSSFGNKNVQSSYKCENVNIPQSSKWGMFAENNTASQDSYSESSQRPNEDLYDSRPYVTFDPEENENIEVKHEESDTSQIESESVIKSGRGNSSKWSGFVASEENANSKWNHYISSKNATQSFGHSDQVSYGTYYLGKEEKIAVVNSTQNVHNQTTAEKENMFSNGKSSKWETFTESGDVASVNSTKKDLSPDSSAIGKLGKDFKKPSLNFHEHVKSNTGDFVNISTTNKSENIAPVFTVGELDDVDFDL